MPTKSGSEQAPPFSLLMQLSEAAADMRQVVPLDAIWTEAERRGGELDGRDREGLIGLGARLDSLLASTERHAETVGHVCDSHADWVNERVRSALNGEHFSEEDRGKFLALFNADGDEYAARGTAIASTLSERMPSEREQLRGKLPALRGGGPIVTDISLETTCHLIMATALVDVALCEPTLGIGCVCAVALMAEAALIGCV